MREEVIVIVCGIYSVFVQFIGNINIWNLEMREQEFCERVVPVQ